MAEGCVNIDRVFHITVKCRRNGINKANLVYCTFDKMGSVENIIMMKDLKQEERKKEEDEITLFRNVILEIDYFGIIYNRFHEIKDFLRDNVNSIEVLEDKNKFPLFMSLCSKHNEDNIFKNIEKKSI